MMSEQRKKELNDYRIAALKEENFKLRDLNAELERRLAALKDELNDYRDKEARRRHGFPPRRLQP